MAAPRNTTYELIRRFAGDTIPPTEIPQLLSSIFDARDYKPSLQQLQERDLGMWVERLDQVCRLWTPSSSSVFTLFQIIDSSVFDERLRKRTLRSLRKTCGLKKTLPKSHYFPGKLSKASNRPMHGGTADVWRATDDRGEVFAAKVFRANHGEDHKIKVGSPLGKYNHTTYFNSRGTIKNSRSGSG